MKAICEPSFKDQSIGEDRFRQIMGSFPTGIGIVTSGVLGRTCAGLTASSIASVSKSPPLISVCLAENAFTLELIRNRRSFAVNLIDSDNVAIAARFATKHPDKFHDLNVRPGKSGAPILIDHIAFAECELFHLFTAGDHSVVIGRMIDGSCEPVKNPLLYFRGQYYSDFGRHTQTESMKRSV